MDGRAKTLLAVTLYGALIILVPATAPEGMLWGLPYWFYTQFLMILGLTPLFTWAKSQWPGGGK